MIIRFPSSEFTPLIRIDFSDEAAWQNICSEIMDSDILASPMITIINDIKYENINPVNLPKFDVDQASHSHIFIVDKECILNTEHPILCIDLAREFLRSFRFVPSESFEIAGNLGIGNMDFYEFADNVYAIGIFRGFNG